VTWPEQELTYFSHEVDGRPCGGWFRVLSPTELEVIALGQMERVRFAGLDAVSTARSVLEQFVRTQSFETDARRSGARSPDRASR
jgi:hypothetical protein